MFNGVSRTSWTEDTRPKRRTNIYLVNFSEKVHENETKMQKGEKSIPYAPNLPMDNLISKYIYQIETKCVNL